MAIKCSKYVASVAADFKFSCLAFTTVQYSVLYSYVLNGPLYASSLFVEKYFGDNLYLQL